MSVSSESSEQRGATESSVQELQEGFVYLKDVDSTIRQDVRYACGNNFVGMPISGYEKPLVILSAPAASALTTAQQKLTKDSDGKLTLLVYDGYRPQRAVDDFVKWSKDLSDIVTKDEYYPNIAHKSDLFDQGYIAKRSGHTRGSTVDLTMAVVEDGKDAVQPLDMGSAFDLFDPVSHPLTGQVGPEAKSNRMSLRELMTSHGFKPLETEWWHFTLENEPFPDSYFDFPVE